MNMGDRIQRLRKDRGYSQQELGNLLDISRQAVSKWELNGAEPDMDNIIKLSDIFDVTTDYILIGKDIGKEKEDLEEKDVVQKVIYYGCIFFMLIGILITIISHSGILPIYISNGLEKALNMDGYILGEGLSFYSMFGNTIIHLLLLTGLVVQIISTLVFRGFYGRNIYSKEIDLKKNRFYMIAGLGILPSILVYLNGMLFRLVPKFIGVSKVGESLDESFSNGSHRIPSYIAKAQDYLRINFNNNFVYSTMFLILVSIIFVTIYSVRKRRAMKEGK